MRKFKKRAKGDRATKRALTSMEKSASQEALREQFREASARVQASTLEAIEDWNPSVGEGLEDD